MHGVLLISEILSVIFKELARYDRRYAAPSVRVCRAWKDPALDALWESLHDPWILFAPYLRLDWSITTPTAQMSPSSWSDIESYAKRVKHLRYCVRCETDITRTFIMQSCIDKRQAIAQGPLFPNLLTLSVELRRHVPASFVYSFLTPSLRVFGLCCDADDPSLVTKFAEIPKYGPNIQHLELELWTSPAIALGHFPAPLKDALCGFQTLKRVCIDSQSLSIALPFLSTIGTLERLEWNARFPWKGGFAVQQCVGNFPSLKQVCGPIIGVQLAIKLLSVFRQSKLRELAFLPLADHTITPRDVRLLTDTIAEHASTLQLVDISFLESHPEAVHETSSIELEPLSRCSNLHTLSLRLTSPYHRLNLSDIEFEQFIQPLSSLRYILITCTGREIPIPPRLTLKSLRALAQHCRDIQSMRLQIDARNPLDLEHGDGEVLSVPRLPLKHLVTMEMDESPINPSDVETVAACIRSLAAHPGLTITPFSHSYEGYKSYTDVWLEVGATIRESRVSPSIL